MVQRIRDRGRGGDLTRACRMFSGADVFVLPTEYEGQPFTIIESLAAGVPVVASDIPAIRSMVADGDNGRLVPWNDPPALASA
ncbi:MAG: glycosyltransferase family 4 protein [Microthrixaceae bacterium]